MVGMNKIGEVFLVFVILHIGLSHCSVIADAGIKEEDTAVDGVLIEPVLTLRQRIELEEQTWHWLPWRHTAYHIKADGEIEVDPCPETNSSIHDFPDDLFSNEQRLQGAIILHFIGAIYFFTVSALVINDYFLPAVQCICDDLKITPDIAAAVFMATATAMPELFVNVIALFMTDSDMGIGTVIGSLMFNTLGVSAIACFAVIKPMRIDWWALTRDSVLFCLAAVALLIFVFDGRVYWYEALILFSLIIFYYGIMIFNKRISAFMKYYFEKKWHLCGQQIYDIEELTDERVIHKEKTIKVVLSSAKISEMGNEDSSVDVTKSAGPKKYPPAEEKPQEPEKAEKPPKGLFIIPRDSIPTTIFFFYSWPIRLILACTMPNPKVYRRLYPLTFIICIVWIAIVSYLLFWMLIVIGYTFGIPESVMGMTFLAAGGCTPEAVTGFIVARKGAGGMGISNSLGASTLAILLALGLPWLVRAIVDNYIGKPFIAMNSIGLEYTIITLILIPFILMITFAITKFRLKKIVGCIFVFTYLLFITFATLVEIDILFPPDIIC